MIGTEYIMLAQVERSLENLNLTTESIDISTTLIIISHGIGLA